MDKEHGDDDIDWDAMIEQHRSQRLKERRQHIGRRIVGWTLFLCFLATYCLYWMSQPLAKSRQGNFTVIVRDNGIDYICEAWNGNKLHDSKIIYTNDSFAFPDWVRINWTSANTFNVTLHDDGELYPPSPVLSGDFRKPKSKALRLLR